ncbi:unnamed protein product [Allacma fusca]|uniref:Uncharacterized protein n=1 Tax=Allacma fusca TaxID=39272 RepID=A0A8J2PE63_9HEXA|nr:unnamed protein product [Allacma fusca]
MRTSLKESNQSSIFLNNCASVRLGRFTKAANVLRTRNKIAHVHNSVNVVVVHLSPAHVRRLVFCQMTDSLEKPGKDLKGQEAQQHFLQDVWSDDEQVLIESNEKRKM